MAYSQGRGWGGCDGNSQQRRWTAFAWRNGVRQGSGPAVSTEKTLLLGAIAGGTIVLGLPLGRLRRPAAGLRLFLNAIAVGVLLFLVWDVLTHALDPVDAALVRLHQHEAGVAPVIGWGLLFGSGLLVGLMSMVYYERWLTAPRRSRRYGPGAMAAGEVSAARIGIASWSPG